MKGLKKIIVFHFLLLIYTANLYAQIDRWNISVEIGPSFPTGKFGSKNIRDSAAAFANIGPAINFTFDYKLTHSFSFSILLSGQENKVDTKSMAEKLRSAVPGAVFNAESGYWKIGKIMGGINFSLPLWGRENFLFTARLMAGALKTTVPKITVTEEGYVDSLGTVGVSQVSEDKKPLPWSFAYLAGVGLKYKLTKKFFLQTNLDYSSASPKAPLVLVIIPGGFNAYPIGGNSGNPIVIPDGKPHYYKQPVSSLNFCVGGGISF